MQRREAFQRDFAEKSSRPPHQQSDNGRQQPDLNNHKTAPMRLGRYGIDRHKTDLQRKIIPRQPLCFRPDQGYKYCEIKCLPDAPRDSFSCLIKPPNPPPSVFWFRGTSSTAIAKRWHGALSKSAKNG